MFGVNIVAYSNQSIAGGCVVDIVVTVAADNIVACTLGSAEIGFSVNAYHDAFMQVVINYVVTQQRTGVI